MSEPTASPPTPTLPQRGREFENEARAIQAPWRPVMRSPMDAIHERLGAQLDLQDGWQIPRRYAEVEQERQAIHGGLGLADITARGKIDIRGAVNGALATLPGTHGATLARISRRWALVFTPASRLSSALELITRSAGGAMVTDATSLYAGIALVGPAADDLLHRLLSVDPSSLQPGDAIATQVVRIPAIVLRRSLPIKLIEIYVSSEYGRYGWNAVMDTAHSLGATPIGWDALLVEGWR